MLMLPACYRQEKSNAVEAAGGNPVHGKQLVQQYGCTSCHDIPSVSGPRGTVGPPLTHVASRQFIAGKIENTPDNLTAYLQNPQVASPQNAMPNMGLSAGESRDIAAFLHTLK